MDNFLQSGNLPGKSEWKKTVIENINQTEIEFGKIKTQRYKQLGLYSQVIKEPMRNMWLQFGLENSEMGNQVAIIVKILCGSFYVDGVRFTGEKTQFYCMSFGNYYINSVKHAMLHCCETQLAGTQLWERITDFFPVEFVANINPFDDFIWIQRLFISLCVVCISFKLISTIYLYL
jgi:hypothetical protein